MRRAADDRIADIRAAIARCIRYAEELGGSYETLVDMASDAIERNIAIIGEAVTHLPSSVTDAIPDIDWAAIRGMRNVLVHEYFGVDGDIVREIVASKLKPLDDALRKYVTTF